MESFMGSVATCTACIFTNPLDVAKTRMQLQGELRARGTYSVHYRNVFHAIYTIARVDGVPALQKGLVAALMHNAVLNGIRLGSYQYLMNIGLTRDKDGRLVIWRCALAGAVSGCFSAFAASPATMRYLMQCFATFLFTLKMDSLAEFFMGSLAACGACVFTNPLEVVKTRMQLQGELKARGTYSVHYRNVFHAFYTIASVDGIRALQKGLVPGLAYQAVMNGVRLGSYQYLLNSGMITDKDGNVVLWRCILAGAMSGCIGAFAASPGYMFKTQLQSKAMEAIAVGTQHDITSFSKAIRDVYKQFGILGLWRGASGAVLRVSVGSAAQLSTFSTTKDMIEKRNLFKKDSFFLGVAASFCSSFVVCIAMTPFDVVSTRLYNQGVNKAGQGLIYHGPFDCISKIFKQEGFFGFYKGIGAHYFRLGPHTILSLVFWNELRKLYNNLKIKT